MGFENTKVYALLYINQLWEAITSADIAVQVIMDPLQHQFVKQQVHGSNICQICGEEKFEHNDEDLVRVDTVESDSQINRQQTQQTRLSAQSLGLQGQDPLTM